MSVYVISICLAMRIFFFAKLILDIMEYSTYEYIHIYIAYMCKIHNLFLLKYLKCL